MHKSKSMPVHGQDCLNNLPRNTGDSPVNSSTRHERAESSPNFLKTGLKFLSKAFPSNFGAKKAMESTERKGFEMYMDEKHLQSFLLSGGILEHAEQQALLKALEKSCDPENFQNVVNMYEDALVNLRLPVSGDTRKIHLEQALKDMTREVIFVNGEVISFDAITASGENLDPDSADAKSSRKRPSKLTEFLERVPAQSVRCSYSSSSTSYQDDPMSPPPPSFLNQRGSMDSPKRKAHVWRSLEKEIRKFRDGCSSGMMQPLISDRDTQRFTEITCTAMARTGFGGDSYEAVMALIGSSNKIIRPVVKPNEGFEPLSTKTPYQTGFGMNSSASFSEDHFDPQDPLPILIEIDSRRRSVQVTTTSVFDIHLLDDLTSSSRSTAMNANWCVPLGRICAVVREEINFDASYFEPIHDRRLTISLMESPRLEQ